MSLAPALAAADTVLTGIPDNGMANGAPFINMTMPSTSHVAPRLMWPMNDDGTPRGLEDQICRYAAVNETALARSAASITVDVETAVIVAVARCAAWRYYGWTAGHLKATECTRIPAAAPALTVHADHADEVAAALLAWAPVATRYMALVYYSAISYETSNHHHLPAVTKKLATTTMALAGLTAWVAGNPARESAVFHDAFHPVSDATKSVYARDLKARSHLADLKFDNLRKRLPVKAADTGIAINYGVLFRKAVAYRHDPAHLPTDLAPPANVAAAVAAYESAATPADLVTAVARLRAMSEILAEPSAYLAGFILGCEARTVDDPDLGMRQAARTVTILGSPAYVRAASDFSGTFSSGKESGLKVVPSSVPDQVLPRCAATVAALAEL